MTAPETAAQMTLDETITKTQDALASRRPPQPDALLLLATGTGLLPTRLESAGGLPLAELDGVPQAWVHHYLHWGRIGELCVWMLEDTSDEPSEQSSGAPQPAWVEGFPCWLAADAGAKSLILVAAGSALGAEGREALCPGQLAFLTDHINLSGSTPLLGLGNSRLGPMFPDQTLLHDLRLRALARSAAKALGLDAREAVAACTAGPSLDTPAERRFHARAGADVAVQGLAPPLLAAAHAGLRALAVVVVTDAGDEPVNLTNILAVVQRTAAPLEDLLLRIAPGVPEATRGHSALEDAP